MGFAVQKYQMHAEDRLRHRRFDVVHAMSSNYY